MTRQVKSPNGAVRRFGCRQRCYTNENLTISGIILFARRVGMFKVRREKVVAMLELDPYKPLPNPGETALIEIRPSVAVIGGGLSGMIAARLLAERGYPVTVFDKGRQPGGRGSIRVEDPYTFDHGCQYFTARDRRFQRYVEAWIEQGIVSLWNARRASCLRGAVNLVHDDVTRYVGVPGMNAMVRHLASGMDVRSGLEITDSRRVPGGWQLTGTKPIPELFDLLISSAPAPQTANVLRTTRLAEEAAKVNMLPCWTAMAVFDYDLELPFDAAHISASPLVWAANNGSKPGRSRHECWVMQASPSWSIEHIDDAPDAVAEALLAAFFEAAGAAPVTPRFTRSHRWRYASPEEPLRAECLWDAEEWVGACGDWCHSARMEGAFISGLTLVERVLNDRPRAPEFCR